jgi:hypothetical protein
MEILKIPAHAFPHDFRHLAGTADSRCEICSEVSFVRNRDHFPEGGLELSRYAADAFACCGADGRGDLS